MNRENVLFSAVGLLLGYVIAFHLVVYVNQSQAAPAAASAGQSAAGPDDYNTVVRLGTVYSSAGRFDDAARWYTAALAKRPEDCDARSELALTFYLRKPSQPEKAIAELRRCLQSDPNHVMSLHNLTLMLLETKQYAESEATLARLEKLDPTYEDLPRLRERLRTARAGAQQKSPTD
jgi:tetratricopeptide (TPR) repeat protein